jgi:hypothetical protein
MVFKNEGLDLALNIECSLASEPAGSKNKSSQQEDDNMLLNDLIADGALHPEDNPNKELRRYSLRRVRLGVELEPCAEEGGDNNASQAAENLARFSQRLYRIVGSLIMLARRDPYHRGKASLNGMPISPCFWIACGELSTAFVFKTLLPHFPRSVQAILGQRTVSIEDLLTLLPKQPDACLRGWLVYLNIITVERDHEPGKAGEARKARKAGLYVGSATGRGGGLQRWEWYDRWKPRDCCCPRERSRQSCHQWFATLPNRVMNLRAIATRFSPSATSFWPLFAEGLALVLLKTLEDPGHRNAIITNSMFDWFEVCSNAMAEVSIDMDFERLNHAWPLRQGIRRTEPTPTLCPECGAQSKRWIWHVSRFLCCACWERSFKGQEKRTLARHSG